MRLVTKSGLDGLTCAMMLKEMGLIDDILLITENDSFDEKTELSKDDITAGLPFDERVSTVFNFHAKEKDRIKALDCGTKYIADPSAKSTARVIYNYYGRAEKFPNISEDLIKTVDRVDSASFTVEEITNPGGWVLFNTILDSKTGLDKAHEFKVSGYDLFMELIDFCRKHSDIEEILNLEDIKVRVEYLNSQKEKYIEQLSKVTKVEGKLAIADYRSEEIIYPGSRYYNHALNPETELFARIEYSNDKKITKVSVEKSVVNSVSKFDIGDLCLTYGGYGRADEGYFELPNDKMERILPKFLINLIRS